MKRGSLLGIATHLYIFRLHESHVSQTTPRDARPYWQTEALAMWIALPLTRLSLPLLALRAHALSSDEG